MKNAEMKIVRFDGADVIVTSGIPEVKLNLNYLGDNETGDIVVSYLLNGVASDLASVNTALAAYSQSISEDTTLNNYGETTTVTQLRKLDNWPVGHLHKDTADDSYNGLYLFDGNRFMRQ